MSFIPKNNYGSRVSTADAAYPQGKAINLVGAVVGTGTPVEAQWLNDDWGFKQAILDEAGITPSGFPDEVGASQYLEGLKLIQSTDLINDISQDYGFDTVALMASSSIVFPLKKKLKTKSGVTIGDNLQGGYIVGASQLDADHDILLADGKYANWQSLAKNQSFPTIYKDDPTDAEIQSLVDGASFAAPIKILGESSYTRSVNWKGREHEAADLPFKIGSYPIAGGNLNARMTVDNGLLYNCSYENDKVEVHSLIDPRFPELVTEWATSAQPRHIDIIGRHAVVCCHAADVIEFYDLSNMSSPTLVGSIPVSDKPKMFVIDGNDLYVVCLQTSPSGTIEKYSFILPTQGAVFSYKSLGSANVVSPLCCAYDGEGVLAVCGVDGLIRFVGSTSMNLISTLTIPSGGMNGTIVFINKNTVMVTDTERHGVQIINVTDITTPVLGAGGFVSTVNNPEQIEIVGNRCYIPGLTTPAKMSVLDITDAAHPYEYKQVDLSVNGAGFTAYHQVGNNGYVYINGHFTPFNIDVIEVEAGQNVGTVTGAYENLYARKGAFSDLQVSSLDANIKNITHDYRTKTGGNTALLVTDNIVRLGPNVDISLYDPALTQGKQVTIVNVGGTDNDVTNIYLGFSGTLASLASVTLVAMDFGGTYQWDAVASHGAIT